MITKAIDFVSKDFVDLCKSHKVKELYAFGSAVNGNFTDESDVDILVDIDESDPLNRGELLLSIWNKLENHFDRKVDLLTPNSLKNPYLKESIDQTKKLIYSGSEENIITTFFKPYH